MDSDRTQRTLEALQQALSMSLAGWMLWTMVPEHQRQAFKMRILLTGQKIAGKGASLTAAASMRAELTSGLDNYALPYVLSLARELLGRAYDRARSVTP